MASKKSKNTGLVVTLLIVSLAGGAVMGAYVINTPNALHVPADMRRQKVAAHTTAAPQRLVPHVAKDGTTTFTVQDIKIPAGEDERAYLVNDYLKQVHASGLGNKDAKALGVDVRDGTAYVDFNKAFDESFGTMDEATLINGILRTLGQYPEIEKVQFSIDGKPMETTGNIDLTSPQPVIRPGTDTTSSSMEAG
jgi:germination protein M